MSKKDYSKHAKRNNKKSSKEQSRRERRKKHERKKKIKKYSIYSIVFLLLAWGVYGMSQIDFGSNSPNGDFTREQVRDYTLGSHGGLAYHIHPHLSIEINGVSENIPSNTGIVGNNMRVIHTHDASGTLHVEPPVNIPLMLEDFFYIWSDTSGEEKTFNETCIFDYCENETHQLRFLVDEEPNEEYGNLEFKDGQAIRIIYEERE